MPKRIHLLLLFVAAGLLFVATTRGAPSDTQDDLAAFKDNSCVKCHSKEMRTSELSNRYLEWHLSDHKLNGVGCEKCHGGDPTSNNIGKSHTGMLPQSDAQSLVSPTNLPTTCATCHQADATAYTGSKHFAALKASGGGPSCSTCHQHMVSQMIMTPEDGAALCATCHVANGSTAASKHLEVPAKAQELVAAIERVDGIVVWANGLLDAAKDRKLDVAAEEKQLKTVDSLLREAKANWHTFTLVGVKEKADQAFELGTKAKDGLRRKMGYN
jgi:hypothetical protein